MVNRIFSALIVLFAFSASAIAQTKVIPDDSKLLYLKEFSGGPIIHSGGWGMTLRYSKLTVKEVKLLYELDIVNLKHPKEIKIVNPFREEARSYVFGKKNVFIPIRTGIGSDKLLFDKAMKSGVEVRVSGVAGLSHGIIKPVYLRILKDVPSSNTQVERYDETRHNRQNILGSAGFFEGIDQIGYLPGLFVKGGLSFDWGKDDEKIKALEVGAVIDAYISQAPILATFNGSENKQYFITFYATVLFGKKW
ncbi:MAG: hypothetical protein ACI81S_000669 [Sphingobacteriales bacterium]|jgi:hypothetical protein